MNIFSGSTFFWRLLGEYEPLSVPYCYCKELSSESRAYGPKVGQNYMKYDFLALFHIPTSQKLEKYTFSGSTIISYRLSETTEMVNLHLSRLHCLKRRIAH